MKLSNLVSLLCIASYINMVRCMVAIYNVYLSVTGLNNATLAIHACSVHWEFPVTIYIGQNFL